MKKILILIVLLTVHVSAFAVDMGGFNNPNKPASTYAYPIMTNFSSTGNGTVGAGESHNVGFFAKFHKWIIDIKGTPSIVNVKLEGSIDDSIWYKLDTYSSTSPVDYSRDVYNKGAYFIRGRLLTFTNGSSISITSAHGGQ
jgi:hypothetical protein